MAKLDLTQGKILSKLVKLSLPIVATGFIQTAYNIIDMFWIGNLGTNEVAAVGTAGFYLWLSLAFILLARTGTEIRVAQSTGEKNHSRAKAYARAGLQLSIIIGTIYCLCIYVFRVQLIDLFKIKDEYVVQMCLNYLVYVTFGIFFTFINQVATGAFNGRGNSKIPFYANAIGLACNIVLDPILIFGIGPFPHMGVIGAAIATSLSQFVVMIIFIYNIKISHNLFDTFVLFKKIDTSKYRDLLYLGVPTCVYNGFFTIISMFIAKIIVSYGASAMAAQTVGTQIEAISWMTAMGFAVAIGAFTGQNFGAKKYDRVMEGYYESIKISFGLGIINGIILAVGAKPIMLLFFPNDPSAVAIGTNYLVLVAISQVFMCLEITTSGCFNGLGKTFVPAFTSTIINFIRIPLAIILSSHFGLNGIWWVITISSAFKGTIMVILFCRYVAKSDVFFFKDMLKKID